MIHSLIIVGVGRSGTSLLQSMFAAHPKIAYMPETSFLRRYVATQKLERHYQAKGRDAVLATLGGDSTLGRFNQITSAMLNRALDEGDILDVALYKQMVKSYYSEDISWVGDKDPRLIEFLELVGSVMPTATVINIIRDPRDVLASKKKAAWSSKGHTWKHIFANRVQMALGNLNGRTVFGQRYHELIYEELISRPEDVLRSVCDSMGLPFEWSMLSFGEAAKKLVSKDEVGWKKETFGPLLEKNKEKWRSELSPREIRLTELCCTDAMKKGQYQPSDSKQYLSLKDRLWIAAGLFVIKAATRPYIFYRNLKVAAACRKIKDSTPES